ncbi:MAG: DUF1800 domain-containing protein [Solirubrobacteraceae bacterium]
MKHAIKHKTRHAQATTRRHRLHRPPASSSGGGQTPVQPIVMSSEMVERLFWRAGFGPTAQDRSTWIGQPLTEAVNWMLTTPAATGGVPGTDSGSPLNPTGNDTDLVLSWIDTMVRSINPFVERMTFFWHRHWANSRETVSPPQLLMTQNQLFRSYADLASNPTATFKDLALAVTIDPSMLRYLTGELNVRGAPNENYAREFMELFTLGVLDAAGQPNYTQTDVEQLAKAFSGWQINDTDQNAAYSYFTQALWYDGPKEILGEFANFTYSEAVDLVLSQPAHPAFIVNALWSEFIVDPPSAATLQTLTSAYSASGFQLKPLLQMILTDPALFASIDQPDMIKPPVVYVVGAMRALGAGVTDPTASDYLDAMGETPYFPPNVSGWEGGLSWLNTDTALARFNFITALLANQRISDLPGESAAAAYARAYAATGQPWLAPGTQEAILSFAQDAGSADAEARVQRQIGLRALILAGPDAQVM